MSVDLPMLSAFTPTIRPNEKVLPLPGSACWTAALLNLERCLYFSKSLSRNTNEEKAPQTTLFNFFFLIYIQPVYSSFFVTFVAEDISQTDIISHYCSHYKSQEV